MSLWLLHPPAQVCWSPHDTPAALGHTTCNLRRLLRLQAPDVTGRFWMSLDPKRPLCPGCRWAAEADLWWCWIIQLWLCSHVPSATPSVLCTPKTLPQASPLPRTEGGLGDPCWPHVAGPVLMQQVTAPCGQGMGPQEDRSLPADRNFLLSLILP